jgi:hypothetical protein
MITVRYHIASLCAMILTLGIGIWIGLAIGSPDLQRRQTALLKDANYKLDQVLQEREEASQQLDQNRQALSELVPHFTHNLLNGKRVAIIRTGDYPDAAQSATDALAQTGATVVSSISISDEFDEATDKERSSVIGSLNLPPTDSATTDQNNALYQIITEGLKIGTAKRQDIQDAIDRISSAGLISYSGDFQNPVDLVIVVGGSSSDPGEIDTSDEQDRERAVLDQLIMPTEFTVAQVVGCEPRQVGTSSVPVYQEEGIASVDCIDEPLGVLDMVFALHGESATYGIKPGARLLAPASLESDNN